MTAVILQPAGDAASHKHFVDTIEAPVPLSQMEPYLSADDLRLLSTIYGNKPIPTWGVTPGKLGQNATKWNRIEVGDVTLFSRHGQIVASGTTTHKVRSEALAEHLWQRKVDGSTWEYVYFLDEIANHEFPVRELNLVAGYKESNVIQGFNVLEEDKSTAILEHFDLASSVYFPNVSESEYFHTLDGEATLDEPAQVVRRKEQGFLRESLFGKRSTGRCCICGNTFPVAFLITAHIKKRSECSLNERKDYRNVVAPMCSFGCDDLYEKRYLYVEDGVIRINRGKQQTKDLETKIGLLEGNNCEAWDEGTKRYFQWHQRKALGI